MMNVKCILAWFILKRSLLRHTWDQSLGYSRCVLTGGGCRNMGGFVLFCICLCPRVCCQSPLGGGQSKRWHKRAAAEVRPSLWLVRRRADWLPNVLFLVVAAMIISASPTCPYKWLPVWALIYKCRSSLVVQKLRIRLLSRGYRFDPQFRKIPHASGQLSPNATTTEAHTPWSPCSATREATLTGSSLSAIRESPGAAAKTQGNQKK